jgi:hypothetical protein
LIDFDDFVGFSCFIKCVIALRLIELEIEIVIFSDERGGVEGFFQ